MRREQWPLVGRHEELDAAVAVVDDAQWRGVVIHGPAGVGKSRLAAEVASQAEADGHAVVRARATAVSASMPFGPIVHLLPPGVLTEADPVARYRMVTASLPAGEGRAVLLLDDMHHLDAASAGLVSQVLDGGQAVLVGTVRDGSDPSPAVASLWRRDDLRRVDLTDLLPDDVDALGAPGARRARARRRRRCARRDQRGQPVVRARAVAGCPDRRDVGRAAGGVVPTR